MGSWFDSYSFYGRDFLAGGIGPFSGRKVSFLKVPGWGFMLLSVIGMVIDK